MQFTNNQYITQEQWKKCKSKLTLENFRGKNCVVGIDLSSGGDLTSIALIFASVNDENKRNIMYIHIVLYQLKELQNI